ncbi:MAG: DNA replication protein [Clostridia bacterium]|nr:DNA replication protein [Clostridia bacterium]
MAERRMFSKAVIDSDDFLELSLPAQALYFHLTMRADDDGFINNPKRIQRMIDSKEDDLIELEKMGFIFYFSSGVVVITHWKLHNAIRKDRHRPTIHKDELDSLILNENGTYDWNF